MPFEDKMIRLFVCYAIRYTGRPRCSFYKSHDSVRHNIAQKKDRRMFHFTDSQLAKPDLLEDYGGTSLIAPSSKGSLHNSQPQTTKVSSIAPPINHTDIFRSTVEPDCNSTTSLLNGSAMISLSGSSSSKDEFLSVNTAAVDRPLRQRLLTDVRERDLQSKRTASNEAETRAGSDFSDKSAIVVRRERVSQARAKFLCTAFERSESTDTNLNRHAIIKNKVSGVTKFKYNALSARKAVVEYAKHKKKALFNCRAKENNHPYLLCLSDETLFQRPQRRSTAEKEPTDSSGDGYTAEASPGTMLRK